MRVALPMRACPIGHEYEMFAPFVKLRPETVVFCSELGEPHDKGSVIIEMGNFKKNRKTVKICGIEKKQFNSDN